MTLSGAAGWSVWIVLLCSSCAPSGLDLVVLRSAELPTSADSLRVTAALDDDPALRTEVFASAAGALSPIGLRHPPQARGRLSLQVEALEGVCAIARGHLAVQSQEARQDVVIPLARLAAPRCACSVDGWCVEDDQVTAQDVTSLWGSAADDLWAAAGYDVLHWDGKRWTRFPQPRNPITALWGSAKDDVWAAGDNGVLLHWEGTAWSPVLTTVSTQFRALWGSGRGDVWVAGGSTLYHIAAGQASFFTWNGDAKVLWGAGARDIWVGGEDGRLARYDGMAWSLVPFPSARTVRAIWGDTRGVWVATDTAAGLHRWEAGRWTLRALPEQARGPVWGLAGLGALDLWIVGGGGQEPGTLLRFDGVTFTVMRSPARGALHAVVSLGPNEVWVGGERGTLLRRRP